MRGDNFTSLTPKDIKTITQNNTEGRFIQTIATVTGTKTLKACGPNLDVDPTLWIPSTKGERSRCIRWRIGWLPDGKTKTCLTCKIVPLTKKHSTICLRMHHRLSILRYKTDVPISYFLNHIPKTKPTSETKIQQLKITWPKLHRLLAKLDYHQHQHHQHSNTLTRHQVTHS